MKYSTIPVIGSLLSCLAGSLNAPSMIIDGQFTGDFNTAMNYVSFTSFVAFCYLYATNNQYSSIPFYVFVICFVFDNWDESSDFLVKYVELNPLDIWHMILNKLRRYKKMPIAEQIHYADTEDIILAQTYIK